MFLRHPSKRALQEWLDRSEDSAVDKHVETCQRCATILEELDTAGEVSLGDALAAVYTAPADLSDRLERRVAARLDSRVMFDVISDLFGAGIETSKLLLTEDPTDE